MAVSSIIYSLDDDRRAALNEISKDIEKTRTEQLNSKFAKEDPALRVKINELHDKMFNELKNDVENGKITPGNSVDKKLKEYEESLIKMKAKGKEKLVFELEKKIRYMKWLLGDKDIKVMPEKAYIY